MQRLCLINAAMPFYLSRASELPSIGADIYTDTEHEIPLPYHQLVHFRRIVPQNSLLNTIENAEMLHDLQILRLTQEQLVKVLTRLHGVHHSGGVGHTHLLGHLVGSCVE